MYMVNALSLNIVVCFIDRAQCYYYYSYNDKDA